MLLLPEYKFRKELNMGGIESGERLKVGGSQLLDPPTVKM